MNDKKLERLLIRSADLELRALEVQHKMHEEVINILAINDNIYLIVSDVLRDFLHGSKEGKYRGWREGPNEAFWKAGARIADPEAKTLLSKIVDEIGVEIAHYARISSSMQLHEKQLKG